MKIIYKINEEPVEVNVDNESVFTSGNNEVLSTPNTDITFNQDWYQEGFVVKELYTSDEFEELKQGLTDSIQNIIQSQLDIDCTNFKLHRYHEYVRNNSDHFKIVSKTRDLFESDFNFQIDNNRKKLSDLLGFELTDIDSDKKFKAHVIVRINRPKSFDFNPPHKDIYEGVDNEGYIPKFINFWIPISGVTEKSSLPIVPKSHLIPENQISRTLEGAVVEGNNYRVRMIKDWTGQVSLQRAKVCNRQVLIFSSHLIHGLAINNESDTTRVALEFRLYKKN